MNYDDLFSRLSTRAAAYGVRVKRDSLGPETPATFDGPTVTIDRSCEEDACCYYLAHALGSIFQWSSDTAGTRAVYGELRQAKAVRSKDPGRMETALDRYLAFEELSSDHAVWLLADLGRSDAIPGYTLFFRADLAAMAQLHRSGVAPIWREFYPAFKEAVARGELGVAPFVPRPILPFQAVRIDPQEVVREEDGHP
jgi:hypothetical protein